jgi:hypothetical protein
MFWRDMLPASSGLKYVRSVTGFLTQAGYKNSCHETQEEGVKKRIGSEQMGKMGDN